MKLVLNVISDSTGLILVKNNKHHLYPLSVFVGSIHMAI